MTIQDFSERTGISKSALRYYESKNLLVPKERGANGYRKYTKEQIDTVQLISSLRLADVSIKDIHLYLAESDDTKRKHMLANWIDTITKKRDLLTVSLRYLESDSTTKDIYLVEKKAEQIIWYDAESDIGDFNQHFLHRGAALKKLAIPFKNCYLKYVSGQDVIKAQIGFGVSSALKIHRLPKDARIEQLPPCIYIAMPFKDSITTIQHGYEKILSYALEHHWTPTASVMEWYHGADFTQLDLLMPVIQMERYGE